MPGTLGRLNEVFSKRGLNIAAQYLQTDAELGYVVVEADASAQDSQEILDELRGLDGTIRARLLYQRR